MSMKTIHVNKRKSSFLISLFFFMQFTCIDAWGIKFLYCWCDERDRALLESSFQLRDTNKRKGKSNHFSILSHPWFWIGGLHTVPLVSCCLLTKKNLFFLWHRLCILTDSRLLLISATSCQLFLLFFLLLLSKNGNGRVRTLCRRFLNRANVMNFTEPWYEIPSG